MDHDAMWTHVRKLMKFRDDFLVMSKMTADEFHEMAEKARAEQKAKDAEPISESAASAPSGSDGTEDPDGGKIAPAGVSGDPAAIPSADPLVPGPNPAPAPVPGA
jgi:hypothetical protein